MFAVATLKDYVPVQPGMLDNLDSAIADHVNLVYTAKILLDEGLVMGFYDLLHRGDATVGFYDGYVYVECQFRVAIFRPALGYMMTCVVRHVNRDVISLSVGFFHDIFLPKKWWPKGSTVQAEENGSLVMVWQVDPNEPGLILRTSELVRVKVEKLLFSRSRAQKSFQPKVPIEQVHGMPKNDWEAQLRLQSNRSGTVSGVGDEEELADSSLEPRVRSMEIQVSMIDDGLGKLSWWDPVAPQTWSKRSWLDASNASNVALQGVTQDPVETVDFEENEAGEDVDIALGDHPESLDMDELVDETGFCGSEASE